MYLIRRLIKANARQEIRLRSASVRDGFLWPQMLADNLKLDPVTLGFLNIIFNLGTNITNIIFWKYFLKNSCSSTIWGTLCSCISNFPPFETILMPPLQLSWFLLPSQKGRKVYSLFSVLSNSDPPSIVSLYGYVSLNQSSSSVISMG